MVVYSYEAPLSLSQPAYREVEMEQGRLLIDSTGVRWDVYDESQWSIAWAIDWEYPPQRENPGLLFDSALGRRRLFPCPAEWKTLSDSQLEALLKRASWLT